MATGQGIGWYVAPGENFATLGPDGSLELLFLALAAEDHRHTEGGGQTGDTRSEKFVRDLQEKPRAIARFRVIAGCAAMHEPLQNRQPRRHDFVARLAKEVRHRSDAARVVFIFTSVQSLMSVFVVLIHGLVLSVEGEVLAAGEGVDNE